MTLRIAVSGLRAATSDLDVTGNNIANSNTTGFKQSRAQFADVYATSNLGSTRDATGQGVRLGAIAQQFDQGNLAFTENSLDLAITGDGFFTMEDVNGSRVFSRAGAFELDKNGFVVDSSGQKLLGFQASNGAIIGALGPLQLSSANIAPQVTSLVEVGVNLDANATAPAAAFDPADPATYNDSTSTTVFDSLGQEHLATFFFRKTAANTWETHLRVDNDSTQTLAAQTLAFDSAGQLTTGMPVNYGAFTPTAGAAPFTLDIDFGSSTQFGADFGVNDLTQDGFTTGRLSGIDIDSEGMVLARFTNGQSLAQGQVALTNFTNPQGLAPVGDTAWVETSTSGAPLTGTPGTSSLGLIQGGALEESNVEVAEQLVNMIIAQRNFQANAQMIRTEDEVMQTIINIR